MLCRQIAGTTGHYALLKALRRYGTPGFAESLAASTTALQIRRYRASKLLQGLYGSTFGISFFLERAFALSESGWGGKYHFLIRTSQKAILPARLK